MSVCVCMCVSVFMYDVFTGHNQSQSQGVLLSVGMIGLHLKFKSQQLN